MVQGKTKKKLPSSNQKIPSSIGCNLYFPEQTRADVIFISTSIIS